ncbi:MAG: hypothetical protein EOO15_08320 [Chitinophagaceae bacterium]|nr:MAG: hypothetical protein EOO15_08320 [Chitinophagaceae bacterium]
MSASPIITNRRWHARPLYLVLFPLFTLGHDINGLFGFIPLSLAMQYLLLLFLLSVCSWVAVFASTRNKYKASSITLCVVVAFVFYGSVSDWAAHLSPKLASFKVLPLLLLAGAAVLGVYWQRNEARGRKITTFLNWLLILFVLAELGTSVYHYARYREHHNRIYTSFPLSSGFESKLPDSAKPDIFLLLMDEYAGPRSLKQMGFNNQPFLDSLQQLGLWVAQESRSNYDFTPFSVSSLLQMQYIDSPQQHRGNDAPTVLRAVRSISDNETVRILRKEGYDIRYEVPFDNSIHPKNTLNEFGDFAYKQLFGNTLAGRLRRNLHLDIDPAGSLFPAHFDYGDVAKRRADIAGYREGLDAAIDSKAARPPRFVYQHLLITHHPYLFGPGGQPRNKMASAAEEAQAYLEQVRYANSVLLAQVVRIRTQGRRNTVILVLSDHGYRHSVRKDEAFENLEALYLPGEDYEGLQANQTPVNAFRIVFNHAFGQRWPLLPQRSIPVKYQ